MQGLKIVGVKKTVEKERQNGKFVLFYSSSFLARYVVFLISEKEMRGQSVISNIHAQVQ